MVIHPIFRYLNFLEMLVAGERIVPVVNQGSDGWFCMGKPVGGGETPDPVLISECIRSKFWMSHLVFFGFPKPSLPQREESGFPLPGYGSMSNPLHQVCIQLQDLSPQTGFCFPIEWILAQLVLSDLTKTSSSVRITDFGLMVGSISVYDDSRNLEYIPFPQEIRHSDKETRQSWIASAQVLDRVQQESADPVPLIWIEPFTKNCIPLIFPFSQPVIQPRRNMRLTTGVLTVVFLANSLLMGMDAGIQMMLKEEKELKNHQPLKSHAEKPRPDGMLTEKWIPIVRSINQGCRISAVSYQMNDQIVVSGFSQTETDAVRFLTTLQSMVDSNIPILSEIRPVNKMDDQEKESSRQADTFFSFKLMKY